jgi:tol-pal system protein YbgF
MIKRGLIILLTATLLSHSALAEVGKPDSWDVAQTDSPDLDFSGELSEQTASVTPVNSNAAVSQQALAQDDLTVNNDLSKQADLLNQLHGLQQELAELRGRLDEQNQLIQRLQEQQLSLYKDLDARVALQMSDHNVAAVQNNSLVPAAIVQQLAPNNNKTTPVLPSSQQKTLLNSTNEQVSYLAAYDLIKNKQYPEALKAMQTFVQRYPKSGYLANAHYWLGELYMLQHNNTQAMNHFEWVVHQYPQSSKCSASLLKLGYILIAAGKIDAAKTRFNTVLNQYPDTHAAQMARVKLDTLGG